MTYPMAKGLGGWRQQLHTLCTCAGTAWSKIRGVGRQDHVDTYILENFGKYKSILGQSGQDHHKSVDVPSIL
jgi:hypothetical protein